MINIYRKTEADFPNDTPVSEIVSFLENYRSEDMAEITLAIIERSIDNSPREKCVELLTAILINNKINENIQYTAVQWIRDTLMFEMAEAVLKLSMRTWNSVLRDECVDVLRYFQDFEYENV